MIEIRNPPKNLTEEQKANLKKIVLMARKYTAQHIKQADPAEAIAIADRAARQEQLFTRLGVKLD